MHFLPFTTTSPLSLEPAQSWTCWQSQWGPSLPPTEQVLVQCSFLDHTQRPCKHKDDAWPSLRERTCTWANKISIKHSKHIAESINNWLQDVLAANAFVSCIQNSSVHSWRRPTWPKCPAISCQLIATAKLLFTNNSPILKSVARASTKHYVTLLCTSLRDAYTKLMSFRIEKGYYGNNY